MIFPSIIKSSSIEYILPRKTVYDISRDTVVPGKMSYIIPLFIMEGKIISFGLLGVFRVLNEVI